MAQTTSGQWSYPLEETNGNARRPPKRNDAFGSQERGQSAHRETKTMRQAPSDPYNVMSDSEEVKQRRVSLKANNSTTSRKRSRNTLRNWNQDTHVDYVDDSAWIHRDKLAEIEIQEMEEAGIYVRPSRRSMSQGPGASARSSRSASRSRIPINDEPPNEPVPDRSHNASYADYTDKPLPSTPIANEREQEFNPHIDTEFRTPEEVAAEQGSIRTQVPRPSTSRIPISKMSPVPVPSNVIGRDSPLPRSRHGSGAGSGNWDEMQYARRARSSSIGSQVILDEEAMRTPPESGSSNKQSSTENSPPKARVPSKTTPKSRGRKGSTPSSTDRPGSSYGKDRKTSMTSQRPGSRAGSSQKPVRPSTSHQHAPEGDPPWIDSMYKPDPRLPPDQQMLPTHAKRMMQEQWEKEGKSGTAYDRDLNPLNSKELPSPKLKPKPLNMPSTENQSTSSNSPSKLSQRWQQPDSLTTPNSTNMTTWPLTPRSDRDDPPPSPRPGTSGGLKLTPKIPTPPPIEKSASGPEWSTMQPQTSTFRVPELDEKQEAEPKKGGCACCVVM